MKLSVATNWDPGLIESVSKFPVCELFGSLSNTPVGGGRPSFLLGNTTQEDAEKYIKVVHEKGWIFNYLLNAPCMGNMEYDKDAHKNLIEYIEWLCEIGVDTVTISIPYLLQIVKRQFSQLKVKVSAIAHVNSVARARFFEDMGADEITLDYMSNRDFEFLRQVRSATKCGLTLLVNDMCLYQCPYRTYHYNICGHASQEWHPLKGFYVDYCIVSCTIQKLSDPAQLIRSRWIRPEDLERYEALGYDEFKISGRRMSTAWLTRATAAYTHRHHEGNLMEIVDGVTPGVDPDMHSPQYETLINGTQFLQAERIIGLASIFPVKPFVNNQELEGFLEYFETKDCANGCMSCDYCETIAKQAIHADEREIRRYVAALSDLQDDLISSHIFLGDREIQTTPANIDNSSSQDEKEKSMTWDSQTKKEFDQIIGFVPDTFRSIANQVIAKMSEDIARERKSLEVQRADVVQAFLKYTPDAFKPDMLNGLKSVGIDPDKF